MSAFALRLCNSRCVCVHLPNFDAFAFVFAALRLEGRLKRFVAFVVAFVAFVFAFAFCVLRLRLCATKGPCMCSVDRLCTS